MDTPLATAVDAWNSAVGATVVRFDSTTNAIGLRLMTREQSNVVAMAYTRWSTRGQREGWIEVRSDLVTTMDERWQVNVLEHEIGHALGLPHETDPKSVMFYIVTPSATISAQSINTLYEQYDYYLEQDL